VATAAGVADRARDPWAPYDVVTPDGVRIQAKTTTAAFGRYDTLRSTGLGQYRVPRPLGHHCDLYVLAYLDGEMNDYRDVGLWEFAIVAPAEVDRWGTNATSWNRLWRRAEKGAAITFVDHAGLVALRHGFQPLCI
jgi:hypothetical protein